MLLKNTILERCWYADKKHIKGKLRQKLKDNVFTFLIITLCSFTTFAQTTTPENSGIEIENGTATLYFENQPEWTSSFNYLCLGSSCVSGQLNTQKNRWERTVSATEGQSYQIQIKISSSVGGQYISDIVTVTAKAKGISDDDDDNGNDDDDDSGNDPTITIQAESGSLLGSAQYYNDGEATDGSGVAYISSEGAGFKLTNAPTASKVSIKYASQLSGKISVFINGNDAGDISFTATGAWVGNYATTDFDVNVPVNADFEIKFQSGDVALNIDELVFTGTGTPQDPTCNDGIQNQGETGVDCGGPNCEPCDTPPVPTCDDGIQNQGETGVDCGGPNCDPCQPKPQDRNPVISLDNNGTHGTILVGGEDASNPGFSLYTFTNDTDLFSTCYDGCETNWPPVTIEKLSDLIITDAVSNTFTEDFGVSARCDGSLQVTYNGDPLYYYAGDNAAGQTNGEGAGNVWYLIKSDDDSDPVPTCDDGIQNQGETAIDCGGPNCEPCDDTPPVDGGTCGDYGLTIVNGKGVLYSKEELGQALYLCSGPGFNACVAPDKLENGYYQRAIDVVIGQTYEFGIQGGPNTTFTVVAGEDRCYFVPTCDDGIQNGNETGVDCGGPDCEACPTCDDGIQNGDETGVDCGGSNCTIGCDEVCNGTPNPNAVVTTTNESFEEENDGILTMTFDDVDQRTELKFSIDGGQSYAYTTPDNAGSFEIKDLAPETYSIWVRWENNDCPIFLGDYSILEGGPVPTCDDGILNNGEERVDCGGPNCEPCKPDPCGDIPLIDYPMPALSTPITGVAPKQMGWTFDLSTDLSSISVNIGEAVGVQMGGNQDSFEFFCSCNQVEFSSVALSGYTASVPQKCIDAGDFYYFFRYKKNGNTTPDPGDIFVYSALFTTAGERIDPASRPTITTRNANWMRYRHPHPQDGITEAIFDAQHNGSRIRQIDRFETLVTDGPNNVRFEQFLYDSKAGHENQVRTEAMISEGGTRIPVRRIEFLEKGESTPPTYAAVVAPGGPDADLYPYSDVSEVNYGNMISYELTAVTVDWPRGAQNYNTFQNYIVGQGFNTLGDPRLAMAGKGSTYMVLTGTGGFTKIEADAIFTQHLITLDSEDDVDDFLEGHHLFHGVRHRQDGDTQNDNTTLGEINIGSTNCQECHFRDGRGSKVETTKDGEQRVPPPVYGVGLLEWIAGAEAKLAWKGDVATVEQQVKNALTVDHGIDPDSDISEKDLRQLIAYTKFLSVPTRSPNSYDIPGVEEGDKTFNAIGCAGCHKPSQRTRSDAPIAFRDMVIRPYTDMKMHTVTDEAYRTPPLWGLGRNIDLLENNGKALILMHDGRATTLEGAILAHGGEASGSRAAYQALSDSEKANLIKFLETL